MSILFSKLRDFGDRVEYIFHFFCTKNINTGVVRLNVAGRLDYNLGYLQALMESCYIGTESSKFGN